MARIVVDLEKLRVMESGLGQYCLWLSRALLAHRRPEDELILFVPPGRTHFYDSEQVAIKPVRRWKKTKHIKPFRAAARLIPGPRYDLWHVTNQTSKYLPWNPSVPVLLTIHDLNFLREQSQPAAENSLRHVQIKVDRADRVTVISKFVAAEVRQWLDLKGKKLDVVYNGVPAASNWNPARPAYAPKGPLLFSIGGFCEKKNFHTLVQMLMHLPKYRLVIAGIHDSAYGAQVRRRIAELGLGDRVLLPGPISDDDRQWFFRNCRAFLFPSLTEGFGLPPIEAMNEGKPVFLSTLTSLPEVGGDAAFYWQDFEPHTMAAVLERGLQQADAESGFSQRVRQHAAQFCWDRAAQQYLSIYREVIAERSGTSRRTTDNRPRHAA